MIQTYLGVSEGIYLIIDAAPFILSEKYTDIMYDITREWAMKFTQSNYNNQNKERLNLQNKQVILIS